MPNAHAPGFELPTLRFVPVELLVPHEQHDDQRSGPLVERLRQQGVLRNPPIVAPLWPDDPTDGRMVVLDGANRSTAAREAGLPHMVVQVVAYDDPAIRLSTWHHALAGVKRHDVERTLDALAILERRDDVPRHARAVLARREAIAFVEHPGGEAFTLHGGRDLHERNALLNAVVDAYRHRVPFHRVPSDSLANARARHPEVTALVVFPHFEPDEILELASSGARLPAGITRHLIAWRALRVDVPLDMLADRARSLDEKNRWLEGFLAEKVAQKRVRFYEESTVLFDE